MQQTRSVPGAGMFPNVQNGIQQNGFTGVPVGSMGNFPMMNGMNGVIQNPQFGGTPSSE
jgi:hypothetical protein